MPEKIFGACEKEGKGIYDTFEASLAVPVETALWEESLESTQVETGLRSHPGSPSEKWAQLLG